MLWDALIITVATVLAVNGWHRGLIASWRGPIAIVLATLAVKPLYVDFSTWLVSRTHVSPETAVLAGYLILWFSIEAVLEIGLEMLIRIRAQMQPRFLDRLAGALYGVVKAVTIAILPLMAVSVDLKIPAPPPGSSMLMLPGFATGESSYLLPGLKALAVALLEPGGCFVVSTQEPSFKPVFEKPKTAEPKNESASGKDSERQEIEKLLK